MLNFNSKFETYLLDQEFEEEEKAENQRKDQNDFLNRNEYPEGFFSEL